MQHTTQYDPINKTLLIYHHNQWWEHLRRNQHAHQFSHCGNLILQVPNGIPVEVIEKEEYIDITSSCTTLSFSNDLPLTVQENILGEVSAPGDNGEQLLWMLHNDHVLIASDGSEKEGNALYEYYVQDPSVSSSFSGGGKCPSYPLFAASFEAEIYGAVAITATLLQILSRTNCPGIVYFMVVIGNEAVVEVIQGIVHDNVLPPPSSSCYELFHSFYHNLKQLPSWGTWEWIPSHQNISQDPKILLNAEVDKIATEFRLSKTAPTVSLPLPGMSVIVTTNNIPIMTQQQQTLHDAYTNPNQKQFLLQKHEWSEDKFHSIDWHPRDHALQSLTVLCQVQILKFSHGWINSSIQKSCINNTSDTCPACKVTVESAFHFLTCPGMSHMEAWGHLAKQLKKSKTIPPIIVHFKFILHTSIVPRKI